MPPIGHGRQQFRLLLPVVAMTLLIASVAHACQVPVFRFALERWRADVYEVLVLHNGPLSAGDAERLRGLQAQDVHGQALVNFEARAMDMADDPPTDLADLWKKQGEDARDEAALKTLKQELAKNEKSLRLPAGVERDEFFKEDTPIELRLNLSLVTLERDDPAEVFLLKSLLGGEPELATLNDPIVFPVIGRGRALYALVGDGINPVVIGQAAEFIAGTIIVTRNTPES